MTNLFAYTPITYETEQPPYISLNRVGGDLVLTVRSPCNSRAPQNIGTITLTKAAAGSLGDALLCAVIPTDKA